MDSRNQSMADSQRWRNYGDVSFLEHGGCMVREKERGMYEVISLFPCIPDYEGDVEDPCIVASVPCAISVTMRMT